MDDADLAVFFVAGIRGGPWRGQLYVSKYSLNLRSFGYRTHLDEPFVSRSMEPITIALDFLKSSSRGGPRVPRPLLLVKVTAAAAARAAPLAKSTRYSFLHSRLSKKDTRTPLFGPPFSLAQNVRLDTWRTRDNSFVASSNTLLARGFPALLAAPAAHLARWLTTPSCIHMYARNGAVWFCTARPEGSCSVPLIALSGSLGQSPIWNYAGSRTRISWKAVDELLALSLALSALKV